MYVERKIRITVQSAQGGGWGPNQKLTLEGLRTTVRITKAGGYYMGAAEIMIYGLTKEHINQLSTWGTAYKPLKNYVIAVEAGDKRNGMSLVFVGTVHQAWADFTNMPDIPMYLLAMGTTATAEAGTVQPTSAPDPAPVAPLIEKLAGAAGMQFENSGVKAVLNGVYHWGSPWKQMSEIARAANINLFQDDGTVAIWPKDQPRSGDTIMVSKETGMRDEPTFTQFGVVVKVEFSRALKYGTQMQIKSDVLTAANGIWNIIGIDYDLQAETPNGNWFVILSGAEVGAPVELQAK